MKEYEQLTDDEKIRLEYLKNKETLAQEKSLKTNFQHPNINQDWDRARDELTKYVSELRGKGKHV